MLATVLLSDDALNVREVARRTELPYSVVQREVDRLEDAGIFVSQRFASSRVVRMDDSHPLHGELRALLLKAYGPVHLLADVLADAPGVQEAFLFGSWAERYLGTWGDAPADVDLLVIGTLDHQVAEQIEAEAEDRLDIPVQLTVVTPGEWDGRSTGFVRTVRNRPQVRIELDR